MGNTLLCVLGLFLLNTLLYGHAEENKPTATLRAHTTIIPLGGAVTLTCSVEGSADWSYEWFRSSSEGGKHWIENVHESHTVIRDGGSYTCRGYRRDPVVFTSESNAVTIQKTVSRPTVTLQPNWPQIFSGETITVRCEIQGGGNTGWTYEWTPAKLNTPPTSSEYTISRATVSHSGEYSCKGRKDYSLTEWSDSIKLTVSQNKPTATLTADKTIIPLGGAVTLTCSVEGSADWRYYWFTRTSQSSAAQTIKYAAPDKVISVSQGGLYYCRGERGNPSFFTENSREVTIQETVSRPTVTLQPNWPQIFSGETIILRCEIQGGGNTEWTYEWRTASSNTRLTDNKCVISRATVSHSGEYSCQGRKDYSFTEWSDSIKLTVSQNKPTATLTAHTTIIPLGGAVTLTCSVEGSADWRYYWFRRTSQSSAAQTINDAAPDKVISVSQGGLYYCRGGRGNPSFFTENSREVTIQKTVSNRVVVTLQPNWPQIFSGETITLRCEIQGGGNTEWTYEWRTAKLNTPPSSSEYRINRATESHSGEYSCKGRKDYSFTEWSKIITLTVSPNRPKAQLSADNRDIPVGGSVTLTCSVSPSSSGWKYFWYRGEKTSEPLTTEEVVFLSHDKIRVSEGGLYCCRGGRGNPVYYTEYSDSLNINKIMTNKAVVTLQPNWPQIFSGETMTLRCEIQDGGDTEWEYEWDTTSSDKPSKQHEHSIRSAWSSQSGSYRCKGKMKSAQQSSTDWSDPIKLTVSDKPQPVLTVSPSWLSPGASVTLSCEVQHPSAGWRFYWYKAVPKLSDNSYRYELLPGSSSNGTEQDSYIVHGQTHTAGYVCTAGRGDPVYYTHYSDTKFVWSGDSAASLTVNPDRVQHFMNESLSLNCEGNSTEWRVSRITKSGYLSDCSSWGTMTGSTCNMDSYSDAVYWCESETGQFSNAVNITGKNDDMIMLSPVHPVAEGDSVTLGCMLSKEKVLSTVDFYKNGKLIQNDTRRELTISAVSKSDEGFYKCNATDSQQGRLRWTSPESWMSVKSASGPESRPFPVLVIVGLVCGVVLIILLLLFVYRYRKTRDSFFIRPIQSESTNQGSSTSHVVNENEAQRDEYSTLLHGDVCLYETIKGSADTEHDADDYQNVPKSLTERKNIGKKGRPHKPE